MKVTQDKKANPLQDAAKALLSKLDGIEGDDIHEISFSVVLNGGKDEPSSPGMPMDHMLEAEPDKADKKEAMEPDEEAAKAYKKGK